jgi:hypothetical protein
LLFDLSARQILKERRWSFVTNTDDHQADSCYERDGTQNRRDRHRIGLLMRELNGTHVHVLFLMGKADSPTAKPTIPRMMTNIPTIVAVFIKTSGARGCEDPNVRWARFLRALVGLHWRLQANALIDKVLRTEQSIGPHNALMIPRQTGVSAKGKSLGMLLEVCTDYFALLGSTSGGR